MTLTCVTWDYMPDADLPADVRAAHLRYLNDLVDQGVLLVAGPRDDAPGGVLLFAAPVEAVESLLAADPFSTIPLITQTTVVPFQAALAVEGLATTRA